MSNLVTFITTLNKLQEFLPIFCSGNSVVQICKLNNFDLEKLIQRIHTRKEIFYRRIWRFLHLDLSWKDFTVIIFFDSSNFSMTLNEF